MEIHYFNKELWCPSSLAYQATSVALPQAPILVRVGLRRGLHLSVLVWAISHSQNQDIV